MLQLKPPMASQFSRNRSQSLSFSICYSSSQSWAPTHAGPLFCLRHIKNVSAAEFEFAVWVWTQQIQIAPSLVPVAHLILSSCVKYSVKLDFSIVTLSCCFSTCLFYVFTTKKLLPSGTLSVSPTCFCLSSLSAHLDGI